MEAVVNIEKETYIVTMLIICALMTIFECLFLKIPTSIVEHSNAVTTEQVMTLTTDTTSWRKGW